MSAQNQGPPNSPRKSPLGDLSWIQIIAGAVAAVLSAWLASSLGVAGTLIGAALGSIVVSISAAFIRHGLETGRGLVVSDSDPRLIEEVPVDEIDPATGQRRNWFNWRTVIGFALISLLIGVAAMIAYEFTTGRPVGNQDNPTIVRQSDRRTHTPTPTPTRHRPSTATSAPASPEPSATTESATPTPAPETTQAPTTDPPTEATPSAGPSTGPTN